VHRDGSRRDEALASAALIRDELNVKQVSVEADESSFASLAVKPNFKALGKRCGPKLKAIAAALAGWSFDEVARLEAGEAIEVEGEALVIGDVLLQRKALPGAAVATDGELTVVLDTAIDAELRREGIARELVSVLQNARKEAGLDVADRIVVSWSCDDAEVSRAFDDHGAAIAREVLAVHFGPGPTRDSCRLADREVGFSLDRA
jgi:isoleucyl-tRNA synthetase